MPYRPHAVFFRIDAEAGAANRSVALLAQRLPEEGFTTEVLFAADGPAADELKASGVEVTVIAAPRARDYRALLTYWTELAGHLRLRPGIVHGSCARSVVLAAPPARRAKARFVWERSGPTHPLVRLVGAAVAHEGVSGPLGVEATAVLFRAVLER